MATGWRFWAVYAVSWVPMAIGFAAVIQSQPTCSGWCGVEEASYAMPIAAVMGVGVWWLAGRFPWPLEWRWRFLGLHLLLSVGFAGLWVLLTDLRPVVEGGWIRLSIHPGPPVYKVFRFMMGLWMYGILAGVSYAIRVNRNLREQGVMAARAEAQAARAQLQSLRAQVNPHFLFNTLHTITALVQYDPPRAEAALEELGDILRYALSRDLDDAEGEVSFAEEWAFAKTYLSIEQIRLGTRLRIETRIDPDAERCRIPPLILQPLVENAVRHGVSRSASGGTLSIQARISSGCLVVRLEDDGPGADPGTIPESQGVGLRSVKERLAALHDGRASVEVDTAPGKGFRVELAIPISSEAHDSDTPARGGAET